MFNIISPEEFIGYAKGTPPNSDVEKAAEPWRFGARIAEAQKKHTLRQVVNRLDLILKHSPLKGISFRRAIGLLSEELEREAKK